MINSWLWQDSHLVSMLLWFSLVTYGKDSSTIIEDVKDIVQTQPETALAYFYFDINDKAKQTSRSLLSSLVLTLTAKSDNYLPIESLYNKHDRLHLPTEHELLVQLLELMKGFKQAYIVFDALDECNEYDHMFHLVIEVIHGWTFSDIHFLVSSRREQHIVTTIGACSPAEICLSAELVGGDIASYIHAVVEKDDRLRRWGHEIQQDMKERLTKEANGMYVYIYLIIVR